MIPAPASPAKVAKYLTTAEVAAELAVSPRTVRRLILDGELAASVVRHSAKHRVYRVSAWALRTYRERHQVRPGAGR